jgi:pimeloyl-ACP methyl ester carboxylesterase
VWGEDDQIAPVALAARWPGEHVIVPGAGHLAEWDAPDAVAGALEAFLRD